MFEELEKNLFAFYSPNQGSNAFLLVGTKTVLVDCSGENNSKALVDELNGLGFNEDDIDIVLFTHGHADHFSGAKPFKKAELWMQKLDADYVNSKDEMYTASQLVGSKFFPKIRRFFEPEKVFDFDPFFLKVLFTPGHTQGSVCFFDENQGLLFSGDLLFKGSVGRWDLQSGDKDQLLESINSLHYIDFGLLLPGHGTIVKGDQEKNIKEALKILTGEFI